MLDKEPTRASFGPRAAAYVIDRALLLVALAVVRLPFGIAALLGADRLTAGRFLFDHSVVDVLCWLLASAYFVLMTYFTGGTLGKKVMRLRVQKADGSDLGLVDVLYRETVGRFLSGILCIGYLMALADRQKRAFHDWLCDTSVVYAEVTFRARGQEDAPAYAAGWTPVDAPAAETLPAPVPAPESAPVPGPESEPVPDGTAPTADAPAPEEEA